MVRISIETPPLQLFLSNFSIGGHRKQVFEYIRAFEYNKGVKQNFTIQEGIACNDKGRRIVPHPGMGQSIPQKRSGCS
jgi:hypothetical protein